MKYTFLIVALLFSKLLVGQTIQFEEVVHYYNAEKNFNGSVVVATNGKIDFLSGIGLANRQEGTTINTQSTFKIASITKTFTAALILKLYEQEKLDLNATIGNYLPEYKGDGRDKVSIHHLLTYSSGIPNCEGNTGIGVYQTRVSVDEFIENYCSGNLEFVPGSQFSYDNGNYIILGRIIEKLTGKSYAQHLAETILTPFEMENTGMLASKDIVHGLVPTYNIDDSTNTFYIDDPMYIENYYSAGAMYSTVEDLLKFDEAIFGYKLLSKNTVDLMLTPYPELYGVAYGFWVTDNTYGTISSKTANRQGSIWGANANWVRLIDKNITVITLSNTNATNLTELTDELVLIATGQEPTISDFTKDSIQSSNSMESAQGTWQIDLRPDPNSEPYVKDFIIEPTKGKEFKGEFYGTKFKGGFFNTDWTNIYFAFKTGDKDNTYYHSGYIVGDKIYGISYCEGRKFTSHWTGTKKQ
jgi:CubicO group peptidase (beta-lactamase class C family)